MKKSKKLLTIIGVIAALLIGFLIGISVDYPNSDTRKVAGTIGKVDNYRNSKVSEAAIELKNDMVSDTTRLKSLQNYLSFYYINAAKMTADVAFALKEASQVEVFNTTYKTQIDVLSNYETFLESARSGLLLTKLACLSPDKTDPIVLRNQLNNAKNIVAQINYNDRVVLEFVDNLAAFINDDKPGQYLTLEKAHDLLVLNEFHAAFFTKNKLVLKFLDKSKLLGKSENNLGYYDKTAELGASNLNDHVLKSTILLDFNDLKNQNDLNSEDLLGIVVSDQALRAVLPGLNDLSGAMNKAFSISVQNELGTISTFDAPQLNGFFESVSIGSDINGILGIW